MAPKKKKTNGKKNVRDNKKSKVDAKKTAIGLKTVDPEIEINPVENNDASISSSCEVVDQNDSSIPSGPITQSEETMPLGNDKVNLCNSGETEVEIINLKKDDMIPMKLMEFEMVTIPIENDVVNLCDDGEMDILQINPLENYDENMDFNVANSSSHEVEIIDLTLDEDDMIHPSETITQSGKTNPVGIDVVNLCDRGETKDHRMDISKINPVENDDENMSYDASNFLLCELKVTDVPADKKDSSNPSETITKSESNAKTIPKGNDEVNLCNRGETEDLRMAVSKKQFPISEEQIFFQSQKNFHTKLLSQMKLENSVISYPLNPEEEARIRKYIRQTIEETLSKFETEKSIQSVPNKGCDKPSNALSPLRYTQCDSTESSYWLWIEKENALCITCVQKNDDKILTSKRIILTESALIDLLCQQANSSLLAPKSQSPAGLISNPATLAVKKKNKKHPYSSSTTSNAKNNKQSSKKIKYNPDCHLMSKSYFSKLNDTIKESLCKLPLHTTAALFEAKSQMPSSSSTAAAAATTTRTNSSSRYKMFEDSDTEMPPIRPFGIYTRAGEPTNFRGDLTIDSSENKLHKFSFCKSITINCGYSVTPSSSSAPATRGSED